MNSSTSSINYKNFISIQKTYLRVDDIAELKTWINKHHCHRNLRFMVSAEVQKSVTIQALSDFEREFKKASHYFPEAFASRVKVIDLSLDVFHYFMNFIEEQVNLIQINLDDNKDFISSWNAFRTDIAYLRYQSDPSLFQRTSNFICYLSEQSKILDQFKEPTHNEKLLWDVWQQILNCPDLLDVGLATLFDKITNIESAHGSIICLSTPIHVKLIQYAFSRCMTTLSRDISWVFDEIDRLIKLNCEFPPHAFCNPAESQLKMIAIAREKVIPQLPFINLKNIKHSQQMFIKTVELFDEGKIIEKVNWGSGFGDISLHINILKIILDFIEKENKHLQLEDNHRYDIDAYFDKDLNGIKLIKLEAAELGWMTLSELKNFLYAMEVQQKCHILIDTYVRKPFHTALHISEGIVLWYENYAKNKKIDDFLLTIQKQDISRLNLKTSDWIDGPPKKMHDTRNVDELLAYIDSGTTHTKSLKKTKVNQLRTSHQQKTKDQINKNRPQNEKSEPEKKQTKVSSSTSLSINLSPLPCHQKPANLPSSLHQQRAAKIALKIKILIAKYQFGDFYPLCGPLAQSFMHLNDLIGNYKSLLSCKSDTSHPAFSAVQVIASAYYHMEQLIRYQRMISHTPYDPYFLCHEHNLKMLLKPLSESLTVDTSFPKLLYLGNFWSFHTCEQLAGWSQLETTTDQTTPEPLKMIATAFESPSSTQLIPALKKYVEATFLFSDSLLMSEMPQQKVAIEDDIFKHEQKFSLEMSKLALEQCNLFIKILESENGHPAILKLKQASQDLIILQEILKLLNKQRIEADFFSQLVRGAVYWQNGVMENLLGAIEYLKTGIDSRDHNLAARYRRIWCKDDNAKKEDFIKEADYLESYWGLVNNLCRYPFEYQKFYSPTHELIVQAEALRSHPEFGQGFKMQNEKSMIYPTLNFFSVQSDQLNVNQLLEKLNALLTASDSLIHNRFIPELQITLDLFEKRLFEKPFFESIAYNSKDKLKMAAK